MIAPWKFNAFESVGANDTSELKKVWRQFDDKSALLVYSNNLQPDLSQLLVSARVPIILCLDDFTYLIKKSMVDGATSMEGIHRATFWYAQLSEVAVSGASFTINCDSYAKSITDIANELMSYLQIEFTDDLLKKLNKQLNGDVASISFLDYIQREFPHYHHNNIERIRNYELDGINIDSIVSALAESYTKLAKNNILDRIYWPRLLFRYGDLPDRYLHGTVALVGPARMIFFGPYLHLPNGRWTAEVEFEVTGCGNDTITLADVYYGDEILNAVSMRLPKQGAYSFSIEFETTDVRKPVQIRLQLLKGAIEGEFLLRGVDVRREFGETHGATLTGPAFTN